MIHPITAEQMQRDYAKALRVYPTPERHITAKDLARQFARDHGIPISVFFGKTRTRPVAWPRQDCMAMLRRKAGANVSTIGRIFGRDHTTVIHGIRASEQRSSR